MSDKTACAHLDLELKQESVQYKGSLQQLHKGTSQQLQEEMYLDGKTASPASHVSDAVHAQIHFDAAP